MNERSPVKKLSQENPEKTKNWVNPIDRCIFKLQCLLATTFQSIGAQGQPS
jgi:hypothetical protein